MRQCNLEGTNLTRANFEGAILHEASLKDADTSNVIYLNTDLRKADLTGTFFYHAVTREGAKTDGMKL